MHLNSAPLTQNHPLASSHDRCPTISTCWNAALTSISQELFRDTIVAALKAAVCGHRVEAPGIP